MCSTTVRVNARNPVCASCRRCPAIRDAKCAESQLVKRRESGITPSRRRDGVMPVSRRFTNWLSATLASRIAGQRLHDAQTGFRAFTRTVVEHIKPAGDRYEYEANFLLDALGAGYRVASVEVPTIYGPRSHFRSWTDTWRMARAFARHADRIVVGAT